MESSTLNQFRQNKRFTTNYSEVENFYPLDDEDYRKKIEGFFIYDDYGVIEKHKNGKYYLIVERSDYYDKDLPRLESIFWDDFAKHQYDIDMQGELHERALELMEQIDEAHNRETSKSLDEYLVSENLNKQERNEVEYLLKKFNEL